MTEKSDTTQDDFYWLEKTFAYAEEALDRGEVPVGCLIVYENREIGKGSNNSNKDKNATKNGTRDLNQTIIACNRKIPSSNIDHSNRGVSQGLINVCVTLRGFLVDLSCYVSSNEACRILRDRASRRVLFHDRNIACTCFS